MNCEFVSQYKTNQYLEIAVIIAAINNLYKKTYLQNCIGPVLATY